MNSSKQQALDVDLDSEETQQCFSLLKEECGW